MIKTGKEGKNKARKAILETFAADKADEKGQLGPKDRDEKTSEI